MQETSLEETVDQSLQVQLQDGSEVLELRTLSLAKDAGVAEDPVLAEVLSLFSSQYLRLSALSFTSSLHFSGTELPLWSRNLDSSQSSASFCHSAR